MSLDKEPEENRDLYEAEKSAIWIDPGIHTALRIAAKDVVAALTALSKRILSGLEEVREESGDVQETLFYHYIHEQEDIAQVRISMYQLLVAISCEGLINRFLYFELPREASETLEKLQPTEKLLLIAAFLKKPKLKSSHIYEGLKAIFEWRNQYAHGHNPGLPTKSLHKNHAQWPRPERFSSFEDDLTALKRTAASYEQFTLWLEKTGTHPMIKFNEFRRTAKHMARSFAAFHAREGWFPKDSEGGSYRFFYIDILSKRSATLPDVFKTGEK